MREVGCNGHLPLFWPVWGVVRYLRLGIPVRHLRGPHGAVEHLMMGAVTSQPEGVLPADGTVPTRPDSCGTWRFNQTRFASQCLRWHGPDDVIDVDPNPRERTFVDGVAETEHASITADEVVSLAVRRDHYAYDIVD